MPVLPDTAILFFSASIALALAPGPDNLFVLTQSALFGRRAGLLVTLGLSTGLLVHTSAVALGVAVIFQTSALAFNALKVAGALYLLYLAWQAFRAGAATLKATESVTVSSRKLYLRGIVMNLTNPKVAIFFLAFLPQFADPAIGPVAVQVVVLGGLFIIATMLVFGAIAFFGGLLASWLSGSDTAQIIMNRIAGLVFVGLALRLLASER